MDMFLQVLQISQNTQLSLKSMSQSEHMLSLRKSSFENYIFSLS